MPTGFQALASNMRVQIIRSGNNNELDVIDGEQFFHTTNEIYTRILGVSFAAATHDCREVQPFDHPDKRRVKNLACKPEADNANLNHPFASREILQDGWAY